MAFLTLTAAHDGAAQATRMGQYERGNIPAEILERPLPLREGIGKAQEAVTTSSPDAQAYYDQGVAYLHSYVWIEAARSFHQAIRIDAQLAMAYLGLSYALGELGQSEDARRASEKASALSGRVTDRERIRVSLRALQLAAAAQPENQSLERDYRKQFDLAVTKYPKDVELLLLRGHLEEGTHDAPGMAGGAGSVPYYERALAQQPGYFATHHYLTHAYENLGRLDRALEHATEYVHLAPEVPHAHHMYGHVLRRVDRMPDAIAEFRRADQLALAYFQTEHIAPEYDWQYHHNLDLLGMSYQYMGQRRLAEATLRRSFELPSIELSQQLTESAWPMLLLGLGRAEQALAATRALAARDAPLVQALGLLLSSRVLMTLRRMNDATEQGDRAIRQMRAAGAISGVLVPELQLTQGEFLLRQGQPERGRTMLREAVEKLQAEPRADAWTHTLLRLEAACRLTRELGEWSLAREFAEQMRQFDPAYAGTHYALAKAADHQGNVAMAREEYQAAVHRWRMADADFGPLTDARQRLAALQVTSTGTRQEPPKRP
ncbi:MAG TPA: hypothetical protein VEV17_12585 [Bryobacteraceae bacterium]|nr:hypothetical protein [Bryobacteraceae bacterium]